MKIKHNHKGVTLIEMLITIAISSILGLGLVSLQYILSQNQVAMTKSYKALDEANFTVSSIVKEIRGARSSDTGAYVINVANDQEFIFYSDIDLDGKTEWVRYYLNNTNLMKEIIKPTGYPPIYDESTKTSSIVSEDVRNNTTPVFYYFNEDWPTDTQNNPLVQDNRLAETKTIKIYLRINEENSPEKDYILESYAQIRSAKNNL